MTRTQYCTVESALMINSFAHIIIDIGGMLVHSVLKSNQIAQHVISDVGNKAKQNGSAGRPKENLF